VRNRHPGRPVAHHGRRRPDFGPPALRAPAIRHHKATKAAPASPARHSKAMAGFVPPCAVAATGSRPRPAAHRGSCHQDAQDHATPGPGTPPDPRRAPCRHPGRRLRIPSFSPRCQRSSRAQLVPAAGDAL